MTSCSTWGRSGFCRRARISASFGTLFVAFNNLPSNNGWEGTVTARTYSSCAQCTNPDGHGGHRVSGIALLRVLQRATRRHDSRHDHGFADSRSRIAAHEPRRHQHGPVRHPDSGQRAGQFIDAATGAQVGNTLTPTHASKAGEVFQFNNVFTLAHVPADVTSCIAFIDVLNPITATPATIEGYVNILDGGTQDGAFFEMKCAVGCLGY